MLNDIETEAGRLRPVLLRYARLQLRDPALAEDVVQDTLLAALASREQFAGRAALQTWLTAILRNKIIDAIRLAARQPRLADLFDDGGEDDDFDSLFAAGGHWAQAPADWGDPAASVENSRFHDVFEACVELLPAAMARVFLMREMLGFETGEICKELSVSPSNCWVLLYRARMRLRECLQKNWFGDESHGLS